jgi:hypothetical protein
LIIWLLGWQIWSWAGIQDDALIHLRYAINLSRTHLITYDGVHPNYGTSSLLYVNLLAFLCRFIQSPNLPHAISSLFHLLLAVGMAAVILRFIPERATLPRILGSILLFLVISPSAVRWLNDGMETSLGLCFVAVFCVWIFAQSTRRSTVLSYLALALFSFFMVLLRTEYSLLCGVGFAILFIGAGHTSERSLQKPAQWIRPALNASSPVLGTGLAYLYILLRMHVLLPDTALAKSDWTWQATISASGIVLASSLSFGIGMMLFWLTTAAFAFWLRRRYVLLLLANSVFPVTLIMIALRGQEIQGIRYLAWAYFFSGLWNILELSLIPAEQPIPRLALSPAYAWIVLLLILLPFEAREFGRLLHGRATVMRAFESQHLEALEGKYGIAADIGYIGFFTRGTICDLNGLVNGRDAARLTFDQRVKSCTLRRPDFLFLNAGQLGSVNNVLPVSHWSVCTQYDFTNLRSPDRHYLFLPDSTAQQTCSRISPSAHLYPASQLLQ